MTLEDYLVLFSSLQFEKSDRYGKPILLITLIEMVDKGVVYDNAFSVKDEVLRMAYNQVWNCCLNYDTTGKPDLEIPFMQLEDDLFWHRKISKQDIAYFDQELFDLLLLKDVRDKILKYVLKTFIGISYDSYREQFLNCISFSGTIYEDGSIPPVGKILLTSKPQWEELSPMIFTFWNESYIYLNDSLTNNGKILLSTFAKDAETLYNILFLEDSISYNDSIISLKKPILELLNSFEERIQLQYRHSCVINIIHAAKVRIEFWEDAEDAFEYVIDKEFDSSIEIKKTLQAINSNDHCVLLVNNEQAFESVGNLFIFDESVYLIQDNFSSISVYDVETDGEIYYTGQRVLLSVIGSDLLETIGYGRGEMIFEDIDYNESKTYKLFKYNGRWFNHLGRSYEVLSENSEFDGHLSNVDPIMPYGAFTYKPHGKLSCLEKYTKSPYAYFLLMALSDEMNRPLKEQPFQIDLDEISILMLANAWELLYRNKEKRNVFYSLVSCIEYIIENKRLTPVPLNWYSSKEYVFKVLKSTPLKGIFRDTVDMLQGGTPFSLLRAWIDSKDKIDIMFRSQMLEDNCLYSIRIGKHENHLEINPRKKRMLATEHDYIVKYSANKLIGLE